MKNFSRLFVVVSLLGIIALPGATQQGLQLGAVLQLDNDRIEAAPGVSFGLAAYTSPPPNVGFDSPHLTGLFSSSLGQYPVVYRGIWLKATVFPGGFRRLEGVDYDPTGQLSKDAKEGWEPLLPEPGGGFSLITRADRLGALPLRFRVRHRDGRDRYSLLIFTISWVKGGSLPVALEIMVQREPAAPLCGEEALAYLRGFLPATATRIDSAIQQPEQIVVPAQKAEQTVRDAASTSTSKVETPTVSAEPVKFDWASPVVGSYQSDFGELKWGDEALIAYGQKALNHPHPQRASEIRLSRQWGKTMLAITDKERYSATLVLENGRRVEVEVRQQAEKYISFVWGETNRFHAATLLIVDGKNRLRTIVFVVDDRPQSGQGGER